MDFTALNTNVAIWIVSVSPENFSSRESNDVDVFFLHSLVNRFAGTRLEDLQGEIASLCKDQHGCRYLQKKLEEGVPEHRDMIFRETFGHFAELMTGESCVFFFFLVPCISLKRVVGIW